MVWVEHWVGRPLVAPPPFPVIVTLWTWMRTVPRATVCSGGPLGYPVVFTWDNPVLGISHTWVAAGPISLAHTIRRLAIFSVSEGGLGWVSWV